MEETRVRNFRVDDARASFDRATNTLTIQKPRAKVVRRFKSPREAADFAADFMRCDVSEACDAFGVAQSTPSAHKRLAPELVDVEEVEQPEDVDASTVARSVSSLSLSDLVDLSAEKLPGTVKSKGSNGRVGKIEVDLGGIVDLVVRLSYNDRDTDRVTDDLVNVDVQATLDLPFISPKSILDVSETLPVGAWLDKLDAFDLLD